MNSVVDLGSLDQRLAGLQRPNGTTVSSGLCRAVAARIGIDVLLVRLAAVALAFAAGLGLVLYAWGTLLTPREGGVAPVRRLLPAFERWSRRTQGLVVVATGLAVVIGFSSQGNYSFLPAVVVIAVVLVARRRSARSGTHTMHTGSPAPAWPQGTPGTPPPPSTATTIEQWRSRLSAHADIRTGPADPLPVVDLYGPEQQSEPGPRTRPTAKPQAPVSWLGAALVALLGGGAAASAVMLGLTPLWLWACVLGTGVTGTAMLLWALLVRSRRLPVTLLVLALGVGATASWLVTESSAPAERVATDTAPQDHTYEFVANNGVVDLSDLDLDDTSTITVEANISNVRVILPAEPVRVTQEAELSKVDVVRAGGRVPDAERPRSSATLVIRAVMSNVVVEYLS